MITVMFIGVFTATLLAYGLLMLEEYLNGRG
jgi:hypothetical protein